MSVTLRAFFCHLSLDQAILTSVAGFAVGACLSNSPWEFFECIRHLLQGILIGYWRIAPCCVCHDDPNILELPPRLFGHFSECWVRRRLVFDVFDAYHVSVFARLNEQ